MKVYQNYIYTLKIRHVLEKFRIFKADIAEIIIAINNFRKTLHRRCLTGF